MSDPKLYLLRLGLTDLYKIGISAKPCTRLASVSGGRFWGQVQIVGVFVNCSGLERKFHRKFSGSRAFVDDVPTSGRTEWFRLTREDVEHVRVECRLWQMRQEERGCLK